MPDVQGGIQERRRGTSLSDETMMNDSPKLSRMARRIIDLLSDGEPHCMDDFVALCGDDAADAQNIHPYLNEVRCYLYLLGYGVLCEWAGKLRDRATYRLVKPTKLNSTLRRSLTAVLNTSA